MKHRLLTGVSVDDLLADWSWYCRRNGMDLGGRADAASQSVTVLGPGQKCRLNISSPAGADADETVGAYVKDYLRCHPDVTVEEAGSEEDLCARVAFDDNVGLMTD